MEELTPRQREILRLLVEEYTASAAPVGSSSLIRIGRLDCSSATVRNELAILEELGYVYQPHTSAGRIPTVQGYRYFVERLMEEAELPLPEQRMIQHQFHQIRLDLEQWMRLTAAVLAHTSQTASLVTPPHASKARFKHLELISINDTLCLLILVLQDSSIHQEMLALSVPIEQDKLSTISNKLNALLGNRSLAEIQESADPALAELNGLEAEVLERVLYRMQQVDRRSVREIYRDGLLHILRQPEFEEVDKFRQIIQILEQNGILEEIVGRILQANGVQVIIGGEGLDEPMDDVSMVLSPYGIKEKASGVLGVVGPMRMPYARVVSTVRYVARLMDTMVENVYGD